jgi:cysteinyl-tRNA synthetase
VGSTLDIHGGGADLIFPHHESEIAQAEAHTGGEPLARVWMHTAMVRHEGEKMSKSLGNLVLVRDLLKSWPADALRLYLGRHHYRESWEHDPGQLAGAEALARQIHEAVSIADGGRGASTAAAGPDASTAFAPGGPLDPGPAQILFARAMDDDLDTAGALTALGHLAEDILGAARLGRDVTLAQEALRTISQVFGLQLNLGQPEPRVTAGWNTHLKRFLQDQDAPGPTAVAPGALQTQEAGYGPDTHA